MSRLEHGYAIESLQSQLAAEKERADSILALNKTFREEHALLKERVKVCVVALSHINNPPVFSTIKTLRDIASEALEKVGVDE